MLEKRSYSVVMVVPALAIILVFFIYPLLFSLHSALTDSEGNLSLIHIYKAFELYSKDILFTFLIVIISIFLIGVLSITIGGLIALSPYKRLVAALSFIYRWPLFIPFIVSAQMMRTFLAKNGLMNNAFVSLGLLEPLDAISFLGWTGIIFTFVWKQTAFSTLMVSGAMAALEPTQIQSARNLGASKLRILFQIIIPQIIPTLGVSLILSAVSILSVLSVPLMIGTGSPTMLTADMAFRISSYGDYGTANSLGLISYLFAAVLAWFYLRHSLNTGIKK
ncbi:sugar ABC transporter permease [Alginatibacterium sediminis]|uniref:Sugar ABC transporter permease n=1 Tax=Alginatibacterium sediminis TaxID=2164068 RepID=A0A420EDD3_9ALTE|nr:ABC transporter permease subunit [Alginatibacterium sediminis]RKF18664.1 sugar ABC transporter permease [Alginatibacterium sediminis]